MKKISSLIFISIIAISCMIFSGCTFSFINNTKFKISTLSCGVGDIFCLDNCLINHNNKERLQFYSTDENVAKIIDNNVNCVGVGETRIILQGERENLTVKDELKLKVLENPTFANNIILNDDFVVLNLNEKFCLDNIIYPNNCINALNVQIENEDIIYFDAKENALVPANFGETFITFLVNTGVNSKTIKTVNFQIKNSGTEYGILDSNRIVTNCDLIIFTNENNKLNLNCNNFQITILKNSELIDIDKYGNYQTFSKEGKCEILLKIITSECTFIDKYYTINIVNKLRSISYEIVKDNTKVDCYFAGHEFKYTVQFYSEYNINLSDFRFSDNVQICSEKRISNNEIKFDFYFKERGETQLCIVYEIAFNNKDLCELIAVNKSFIIYDATSFKLSLFSNAGNMIENDEGFFELYIIDSTHVTEDIPESIFAEVDLKLSALKIVDFNLVSNERFAIEGKVIYPLINGNGCVFVFVQNVKISTINFCVKNVEVSEIFVTCDNANLIVGDANSFSNLIIEFDKNYAINICDLQIELSPSLIIKNNLIYAIAYSEQTVDLKISVGDVCVIVYFNTILKPEQILIYINGNFQVPITNEIVVLDDYAELNFQVYSNGIKMDCLLKREYIYFDDLGNIIILNQSDIVADDLISNDGILKNRMLLYKLNSGSQLIRFSCYEYPEIYVVLNIIF